MSSAEMICHEGICDGKPYNMIIFNVALLMTYPAPLAVNGTSQVVGDKSIQAIQRGVCGDVARIDNDFLCEHPICVIFLIAIQRLFCFFVRRHQEHSGSLSRHPIERHERMMSGMVLSGIIVSEFN
jgi:hypothetical protein